MSETKPISAWRFLSFFTLLCLQLSATGCGPKGLNTEYGKVAGRVGSDSLNGVSVLADMFAQRGFTVKRRSKISPRIEQFDSIVWFPDDYSCPSEEAIEALNAWFDNYDFLGSVRTLIYVGRDYDAQADYLTRVMGSAPIDQREELLRRIAEARFAQDRQADENEFFWLDEDTTTCEWFEHQPFPRQKTKSLRGPLVGDADPAKTEIEFATILVPTQETIDGDGRWTSESWLEADGEGFVLRLTDLYDTDNESQIFVVSNGSFLLNYALVNSENRKLAGELIDNCDPTGDVLFLESGPNGIEVSDSDTINHNTWAWIAQPPFRYIVPHFLMWGVLFCFVYFPIFGRPKILRKRNTSSFRNHVNAMGKLIGRSNLPNRAIEKIRNYQHLVSGESKRNKKD